MGYAQLQKFHDLKSLRSSDANGGRLEVLRIVLATALDVETAAWCLGCPNDAPVVRWPSTLYRVLAQAALHSERTWRRCGLLLDRTLHEPLQGYEKRPAAELAELFVEGRQSLAGDELAAVLWCLIRRRCRSHDLIAERLGLELEVVAAQRLRGTTG
jgi:hypothetical protein